MRPILVLLFVAFLCVPTIAQTTHQFKSERYRFSLEYPDTYKQMDPQGQHREAIVLSSVADEWASKNTVDIEVTSNVDSLAAFCKKYEGIWAGIGAFKDFAIVGKKDSTFNGLPCTTYTCTAYVPENQKMIEWRSTFFLRNGNAWKVTLSSFPDRFPQTIVDTKSIFESIKFE